MHGDEGNQGVKLGLLLETGVYCYDPHDHHGPSLYYLTLPSAWACGAKTLADLTEPMLRVVPVLFGVGVVLLLLAVSDALGRAAAVAAGVLTALSPAMVYYSRYYIQETFLVFFTFGCLACGWRYTRTRRAGWLLAAGAMLGLMHATKETWVFAAAAIVAGLAGVALWRRWVDHRPVEVPRGLDWRHFAGAAAVAVAVSVLFFSSFFTYARGPLDSVLTYVSYLNRAGGVGLHDKPWSYYLAMLVNSRLVTGAGTGPWWSEGLILGLAVVGMIAALARRGLGDGHPAMARFLTFYTLALAAAYAAVPYKTPWCVLGMLHGMILLAGIGAAALVRWVPTRPLKAVVCLGLAALAVQLGWQAYRASFVFPADQRNPYVYAHTSPDVYNLLRRVDEAASVSPDGRRTVIKVITPENYWPLPWYLREFPHVGYWHEVPDAPDAPVILTSPEFQEALGARLRGTYNKQSTYGLRPGVLVPVYVEQSLWDALVARWSGPKPAAPPGGAP